MAGDSGLAKPGLFGSLLSDSFQLIVANPRSFPYLAQVDVSRLAVQIYGFCLSFLFFLPPIPHPLFLFHSKKEKVKTQNSPNSRAWDEARVFPWIQRINLLEVNCHEIFPSLVIRQEGTQQKKKPRLGSRSWDQNPRCEAKRLSGSHAFMTFFFSFLPVAIKRLAAVVK